MSKVSLAEGTKFGYLTYTGDDNGKRGLEKRYRFVINSMTCDQECAINSAPTFTHKSIQCLHYIDQTEREKDVLFFLDQQMQRTQDADFLVDDTTIWGFDKDCNVKSKYECIKTRYKSSRIVKITEGSFLVEAIFECDGYRELAV